MTGANLVKSLAAEIRTATRKIILPTEQGEEVSVNVFEQYLPADLFEVTTYFPCVVVELVGITDNLTRGSIAEIALSFGTYSEKFDAWQDCFHLMEVVRERLLTRRIIDKRFSLRDEAQWQPLPSSEQPVPFFFAEATLTYEINQHAEQGVFF